MIPSECRVIIERSDKKPSEGNRVKKLRKTIEWKRLEIT